MRRLVVPAILAVIAACTPASPDASATDSAVRPDSAAARPSAPADAATLPDSVTTPAPVSSGAAAAAPPSGQASVRRLTPADVPVVRALYVNRWAAQSPNRMRSLIAIADSTEINGLVIDLKDEFGLNYSSGDPLVARNAGTAGAIPRLGALLDTLHAHRILPIARLVVFKDSVAARANPEHTIRKPDGTPWRDKEGLTWVNPYDRDIWEYNMRVAEEAVRMGFTEIQFDYIRFPEPYSSLPKQTFPKADGQPKPKAIAGFLREACGRIRKLGGRCTADIFGLVTTVNGPLEIGQHWEELAPVTDVLLPMVYPSHYPRGSFGLASPNAEPYAVIKAAISRARERNAALGITTPEPVRPWLQAFTLGKPPYEAHHVAEQIRATYDAGYKGWVLWHPGSKYGPFLPALKKADPE